MKIYKWFNINDEKKTEINSLQPVFIAGSRDITEKRIVEITKMFLGKVNIIWGCLEDKYINGLEDSPQFATLPLSKLEKTLETLNSKNIYILRYFERDLKYILKELDFKAVIYIQGSWYRSFHYNPHYFELLSQKTQYKLISPFCDEDEAVEYAQGFKFEDVDVSKEYMDEQMMKLCKQVAKRSFDHTYQAGSILAKDGKVLLWSYNSIKPFETYAMHYGALREKHFCPPNDANYYDTNHAEIEMLVKAGRQGVPLKDTTLYINLMPCPTCARALCATEIKEVVYEVDHSEGFAVKLLEKAGKTVRRLVV